MIQQALRLLLSVLIGGTAYILIQLTVTVYLPITVIGRLLARPETWFDTLTITLYNEQWWSYAIAVVVAIIFFLLTPPPKAAEK